MDLRKNYKENNLYTENKIKVYFYFLPIRYNFHETRDLCFQKFNYFFVLIKRKKTFQ